jgi:hypothetical protein
MALHGYLNSGNDSNASPPGAPVETVPGAAPGWIARLKARLAGRPALSGGRRSESHWLEAAHAYAGEALSTTLQGQPADAWVHRLKAAYEAGYYKTETAVGEQTHFPWQGKTCGDCPFWSKGACHVFGESRRAIGHTCTYFDEGNREQAETIMQERAVQTTHQWWEWLNK